MMNKALGILATCALCLPVFGQTTATAGPAANKPYLVRYVLRFYPASERVLDKTVVDINFCLGGRCVAPESTDPNCPPKGLCETIVIHETKLAGNSYQYKIENTLIGPQGLLADHDLLRTHIYPVEAASLEDAREALRAWLEPRLKCHDQSYHEGPDTGATKSPLPAKCQCEPE